MESGEDVTCIEKLDDDSPRIGDSIDMEPEITKVNSIQPQPSTSLFPAYNLQKKDSTSSFGNSKSEPFDWLSNTSFSTTAADFLSFNNEQSTEIDEASLRVSRETNERLSQKAKKRKKKSKKKKEPEVKEKKEPEKDDSLYGQLSKMVFIEETGLAAERAYRVDPKPDRENFEFDTFYKVHIAKYYQNIAIPLGVPSQVENVLLQFERKSKQLLKKEKELRYFSSKNVSQYISKVPVPLCSAKDLRANETVSYIPLSVSFSETTRKMSNNYPSDVNPLGIYDAGTASYLAGVGKLGDEEKQNLQELKHESSLYKRTQTYNEALRENPNDENLWLEFVSFQDELSVSNPYESDQISNSTNINKALLEKKIAILDKALASNPRLLRLATLRLDLCSQFMPRSQILSEWKNLTFVHAGNPNVWNCYIEFLKSSLTSFTVSSIVKAYVKAISTLNNILQGTFNALTKVSDLEEKLLELFSNYCLFLRESGLTERSIATFQAAIEFNFFEPNLPPQTTFNDKVTSFEPFWDSGMARIGEEGAQGWNNIFVEKLFSLCHSVGFTDLNEMEDKMMEKELAINELWLNFENLRIKYHWLPWRPQEGTDEDCEDPDRLVVLDDVSPILFQLQSENGKLSLVLNFLRFLGVSTEIEQEASRIISTETKIIEDVFCETVSLPNETNFDSLTSFINRLLEKVKPKFNAAIQNQLDKIFLSYCVKEALSNCKTKKEFNARIKNLKKTAKNILKDENNRNCLILWNQYAQFEHLSGKVKETFLVYDTVFSSHCGISSWNRDLFQFALNVVETITGLSELSKIDVTSDHNFKLKVYLTVLGAGDRYKSENYDEISTVLLLRAKNGYTNLLKEKEANYTGQIQCDSFGKKVSDYALCICCYLYFQYLTYGLKAPLEFVDSVISSARTKDGYEFSHFDILYLNKCRVKVLRLANASLSVLRPALETVLKSNPEEISQLTFLMNIEEASYLSRHLRRFFATLLNSKHKNSALVWIYAIISEWRRLLKFSRNDKDGSIQIPQVGVSWKIRNLFERSLTVSSVSNCPLLWRMYIKYEMDQGCRDKAKAVFYRSLQKCPGHKSLYLDSAKYFPESLDEISDLLTEKEIRVRTPLEEIQLLLENKKSESSPAQE